MFQGEGTGDRAKELWGKAGGGGGDCAYLINSNLFHKLSEMF